MSIRTNLYKKLFQNLTFFSKNGPKNHFLSILTIGEKFRIQNSEFRIIEKYFYKKRWIKNEHN